MPTGRSHSDSFWPSTGGGDKDDGHGTGSGVEGDGAELRTAVPDSWGLMSMTRTLSLRMISWRKRRPFQPYEAPVASAISKASATPTMTTAVGDDKPDDSDHPPTPKTTKKTAVKRKPAAKSSGPGCSDHCVL